MLEWRKIGQTNALFSMFYVYKQMEELNVFILVKLRWFKANDKRPLSNIPASTANEGILLLKVRFSYQVKFP